MKFTIPDNILSVLNALKDNNFEAFLVGGCVRDMLLGITPLDYDITTSATPEQIKACFERTIDTGIKHGTVTVIIDKTPIEVTTFRTEDGYNDFRRPDKVHFVTDINEDLSRRDFTVNAIAYNPETRFVDPFGGMEDINKGILRAVGNGQKRFNEDALRIMRLFRFASVLGFDIDETTKNAAIACSKGLEEISVERIFTELKKLILGEHIELSSPLFDSGALKFLGINSLNNADLIKNFSNENLKFFAFLYFCCKGLQETLCLLKASNKTKDYFKCLSLCLENKPSTKEDVKRLLNKVSEPYILFDAAEFIRITEDKDTAFITEWVKEILEQNEPYKISHLAISGEDLKNQGLKGREIKEKLEYLLERVIENKDLNQKNILLNL